MPDDAINQGHQASVLNAEAESRSAARRGSRLPRLMEAVARRFAEVRLPYVAIRRDELRRQVDAIPRRMQLVTNQAQLVLELVEDFREGHYREVPWRTIAVAAGALLYTVSPADVVPDALPLIGALDDLVVVTCAMRWIRDDLRAYCEFKGYDVNNYFTL